MFDAQVNGQFDFQVSTSGASFELNGQPVELDLTRSGHDSFHVLYQGYSYNLFLEDLNREDKTVVFRINGKRAEVKLTTELDRMLKELGMDNLGAQKASSVKAPMPGLIHSVHVKAGDTVKKGDQLLILEAMKMENVIKSPADGVIAKVSAVAGATVDKGELLVSFEK
ncbi:MAG: biotin/lipoyl-binding protein [Bacteroidia bacterium]|nr:biotin/lipoyl-binding protein [Bacteroidia bacterium]